MDKDKMWSPCAACKTLARKCKNDCIFAPFFPPNQPQKFEAVHKVYGASNVAKILSDLPPTERAEAVTSLVYEAEARLNDPIYGCVGSISIHQHRLKQIQTQMDAAKQELATYVGPSAMEQMLKNPMLGHPIPGTCTAHIEALTRQVIEGGRGGDMLRNQEHNQRQQAMDLLGINGRFDGGREQDMLRNLERHPQQQIQHQQPMDVFTFNRRFEVAGPSGSQLAGPGAMSPSLAFGGSYGSNVSQIHQQHQPPQQQLPHHLQHQLMVQQQNQPFQLQSHSHSQGQHHDLHQHITTHQPMLQQQTQQPQYPQRRQHDHPTWLLPHQPLLQQQNQPLQHPQQEQHHHPQPNH